MAESFGVPVVGIGDELPNYAGDTLSGKVEMHDWIDEGQTFQPGEEIFSVILTFPSLENPVVLSELAWLGSPETQRELAGRKMRVLCVVSASKFDLKSFMGDCATLVEVEGWNLDSKIPLLIDDAGDFQRMLGCVRPGAADGLRGRVPSSLTLVVCPKHEVIFRSEYPITTGRNFVEMFRMLDSVRSCA
jgi:alkyl hydroperoxide reductase subunit AhpC